MLSPTGVYEAARKRLDELRIIEKQKDEVLSKYPPGKIHVVNNRKHTQYYLRKDTADKSGIYIHKKEDANIRKYLQKAYDEKVQKLIKKEIKSIETFLKHSEDINIAIQEIYSNNSQEVKSYLRFNDCSDEDFIACWNNCSFVPNPYPIQITEYRTNHGELVRSKSEMNIANALLKAGIPYKYECPVKLKSGMLAYPDFTLLDVKNRRQIYWEHRGMMDDRDYTKSAVKKIKEYSKSGIVLGRNLIITEEIGSCPLGTDEINAIIQTIQNLNVIV